MLSTTEWPHVVKRPHHRLANAADILDREHFALYPVHVHQVSVAGIEAPGPAAWQDCGRVDDGIVRVKKPSHGCYQVGANQADRLSPFAVRALDHAVDGMGVAYQHLGVDIGLPQGLLDPVGSTCCTAFDI